MGNLAITTLAAFMLGLVLGAATMMAFINEHETVLVANEAGRIVRATTLGQLREE